MSSDDFSQIFILPECPRHCALILVAACSAQLKFGVEEDSAGGISIRVFVFGDFIPDRIKKKLYAADMH